MTEATSNTKNQPQEQSALSENKPTVEKISNVPEKTLFTWKALERPFKKRNREFWVSVAAMAIIAGFILYLIEGPISVLLIIALVFLFYVMATVEPKMIEYKITNRAVWMAETQNPFDTLSGYWFTRRSDVDLIVFQTGIFPWRVEMVIDPKDKEKIEKALKNHIYQAEEIPSNLDRATNWFSNRVPGNKDEHPPHTKNPEHPASSK